MLMLEWLALFVLYWLWSLMFAPLWCCSWLKKYSFLVFSSNPSSYGWTYFLVAWVIGREKHVSSTLVMSLDSSDLVLYISSWTCGTEPWVLDLVPVYFQFHVAFTMQRVEKIDVACDPPLLAVWQQFYHLVVGLCVWWNVVHRLVAQSSWWIATLVPLTKSGLICASDCWLLGVEM